MKLTLFILLLFTTTVSAENYFNPFYNEKAYSTVAEVKRTELLAEFTGPLDTDSNTNVSSIESVSDIYRQAGYSISRAIAKGGVSGDSNYPYLETSHEVWAQHLGAPNGPSVQETKGNGYVSATYLFRANGDQAPPPYAPGTPKTITIKMEFKGGGDTPVEDQPTIILNCTLGCTMEVTWDSNQNKYKITTVKGPGPLTPITVYKSFNQLPYEITSTHNLYPNQYVTFSATYDNDNKKLIKDNGQASKKTWMDSKISVQSVTFP